jgi:glyoxylase I family protein
MELSIERIDHIYVTVSDLPRAERFYDPVMQSLGFRKGTRAIAGEPHVHYFNRQMQYTIRPARSEGAADAYRPGALHHLCFQVLTRAAVDLAHARLRALGVEASPPALYPDYRPDYYASFFSDPDGIRLEVVCDTVGRSFVRRHFEELAEFENPVDALRERRPELFAQAASGEIFEELARLKNVRIERITSSALPDSSEYDQEQDEWVMLVQGAARLEVAGKVVELGPGYHLLLPAHTRHRVLETSPGALWIAVHVE